MSIDLENDPDGHANPLTRRIWESGRRVVNGDTKTPEVDQAIQTDPGRQCSGSGMSKNVNCLPQFDFIAKNLRSASAMVAVTSVRALDEPICEGRARPTA